MESPSAIGPSESADPAPTCPLMTSNNERLPYDILGLVFHQYSLTPPDPNSGRIKLETLLLVCKSWLSAALGHQKLWSCIEIVILDQPDLLYWQSHARLRVLRSPPAGLLDVVLIAPLCAHEPSSSGIEMLWNIALDIIGTEGCIAKRWRTLCLGNLPDPVLPLFCVPTPNLVDLELFDLGMQRQRLPDAPALETFRTNYSKWLYPNLQSVTDLTVKADCPEDIDAEAISKAQKLIKLTMMYDGYDCQLRGHFPALEYLHLDDAMEEGSLNGFSAPRLKILSLAHYYPQSYSHILECTGIRFQALEELILCLDPPFGGTSVDSTHHDGVRLVLQATVNLKVLRVTSGLSLHTMLEILDDLSICQNHRFTLKYSDYSMVLCQGEARRASIAALRSEAVCSP